MKTTAETCKVTSKTCKTTYGLTHRLKNRCKTTIFILTIFIFVTITAIAQNQYITIPDTNFLKALIKEGVDKNKDGRIDTTEANAVKRLDLSDRNNHKITESIVFHKNGIKDIKEIEYFKNLTFLDCSNNYLSFLNLSKNVNLNELNCSYNYLKHIDITKNVNLEKLNCGTNKIKSLDISKNIKLKTLWCLDNQIEKLNIYENKKLDTLICWGNKLKRLDLSLNINLIFLSCGSNALNALDISNCKKLKFLYYQNNINLFEICVWEQLLTKEDFQIVVEGSEKVRFVVCDKK